VGSAQALAVGDSLTASFRLAFTDTDGGALIVNPTSIRFAFFNTVTTSGAPQNVSGIGIASNFTTAAANNTFAISGGTNSGGGTPLSGTFSAGQAGAGNFGASLAGSVSYTLTRTTSGSYSAAVSFLPNGASTPNSYSFTGLASSLSSFSVFGVANTTFGASGAGAVVPITLVDDLLITYTAAAAIPEPSGYAALAGLGMLGLVALRRRRG
jgi:hypothetical protein